MIHQYHGDVSEAVDRIVKFCKIYLNVVAATDNRLDWYHIAIPGVCKPVIVKPTSKGSAISYQGNDEWWSRLKLVLGCTRGRAL